MLDVLIMFLNAYCYLYTTYKSQFFVSMSVQLDTKPCTTVKLCSIGHWYIQLDAQWCPITIFGVIYTVVSKVLITEFLHFDHCMKKKKFPDRYTVDFFYLSWGGQAACFYVISQLECQYNQNTSGNFNTEKLLQCANSQIQTMNCLDIWPWNLN